MIDKDTLDLADTDDLIDALSRRFNCMVLAYTKPADTVGDEERSSVRYSGGLFAAIGLAAQLKHDLLQDGGTDDSDDD